MKFKGSELAAAEEDQFEGSFLIYGEEFEAKILRFGLSLDFVGLV